MKKEAVRNIFPKVFISFVLILLFLILLTKIGGEFPNYPPVAKKPISWGDLVNRIPHLIIVSFFISIIFSWVLYWDWIKKNNK
jgi:hypothetical protein